VASERTTAALRDESDPLPITLDSKVADFHYDLPDERIAQEPIEPRDSARLLAHELSSDRTRHRSIREIPQLLERGDLLVVNDTRVRAARLFGTRRSGGRVELLLLEREHSNGTSPSQSWRALVRPAGRLKIGEVIELEGDAVRARAVERMLADDGSLGAEWRVELSPGSARESVESALERVGRMPLPPYIRRTTEFAVIDPLAAVDRLRYQTVFARAAGAVAAPTAGLHFTPEVLRRLDDAGVHVTAVTLHVGAGTFRPVSVDRVSEHRMHAEEYVCSETAARAVAETRDRGGRVIAVGTTSARVLETCADERGHVRPGQGATSIFISPGHRFRAVDALLTNFHLPRSTLIMLVSAFAGRERVLELYSEAIAKGYRFLSYGDAMLLLP
jgi:S-adenosylmethionine:tRNA ribosyltransferase-isomerase